MDVFYMSRVYMYMEVEKGWHEKSIFLVCDIRTRVWSN